MFFPQVDYVIDVELVGVSFIGIGGIFKCDFLLFSLLVVLPLKSFTTLFELEIDAKEKHLNSGKHVIFRSIYSRKL